ncbi:MAG TPA: energy transducer TonB [Chitinophagales bacterium]|nr:energy transducer TonB [Chitinophagales bacterium]HMW12772.1 energy transducer TonB [Chitinophagales bacterium]HMY24629.1 energy transducer TonB [Chitinophagales bacterium]HMZ34099.1 energy transducer TonB [Chitinophagales bacterium]HNB48834.1 energy transducer TonB [Chitinophagales bacterium]
MKTLIYVVMLMLSIQAFAKSDGVLRPQFPGGEKALAQYLDTHLKYPEEAQKQKYQGQSLVAFTVNEDGSLTNVRILKSSHLVLDTEALRIIKNMPKWSPAQNNGAPKKEMVVLPITFDLNKKNIQY